MQTDLLVRGLGFAAGLVIWWAVTSRLLRDACPIALTSHAQPASESPFVWTSQASCARDTLANSKALDDARSKLFARSAADAPRDRVRLYSSAGDPVPLDVPAGALVPLAPLLLLHAGEHFFWPTVRRGFVRQLAVGARSISLETVLPAGALRADGLVRADELALLQDATDDGARARAVLDARLYELLRLPPASGLGEAWRVGLAASRSLTCDREPASASACVPMIRIILALSAPEVGGEIGFCGVADRARDSRTPAAGEADPCSGAMRVRLRPGQALIVYELEAADNMIAPKRNELAALAHCPVQAGEGVLASKVFFNRGECDEVALESVANMDRLY